MKPPVFKRRFASRGATMTEYALILVAVLLIGAGAVRLLGGKLSASMKHAGDEATSSESHSSGGDTSSGSAGKTSAKSGTSDSKGQVTTVDNGSSNDEKSSVAGKASVGGAHDKNAAPTRAADKDPNQGDGNGEVAATIDTSFGLRKGLALAMMALGVGTILFFIIKAKRVAKDVREAGK